ncbi:hypothetical protein AMATHDRAFT_2528 [Amanita thiersii Skay4041]|uniref:PHD-type domain-containing protein n=1 Tax=Amanita thiersii Skay4041 TaxID=703135 RepID=A0A2A9NWF0_9AGAR|nr:hypothetical protein AMATHDRAFT_2528 [Amanita thiersii Skay4041]
MACSICHTNHSSSYNFLLTCFLCFRRYHHRCHFPPVSDQELVARLKASVPATCDPANDLSKWLCQKCKNRSRPAAPSSPIIILDSDPPSPSSKDAFVDLTQISDRQLEDCAPPIDLTVLSKDATPLLDLTALSDSTMMDVSQEQASGDMEGTTPSLFRYLFGGSCQHSRFPSSVSPIVATFHAPKTEKPLAWLQQMVPELSDLNWIQRAIRRRQDFRHGRFKHTDKNTPYQSPRNGRNSFVFTAASWTERAVKAKNRK